MQARLSKEIEKLKKNILSLGTFVEELLEMSLKAFMGRDVKMAAKVVENDAEVDRLEVEMEEECLKLLALHQPVAIDLRFIVAVLKINSDLERIGDLAVNIAQRAELLSKREKTDIPFDFSSMYEKTKVMLRNSLDALVTMDAQLARDVMEADNGVDAIHREAYKRFEDAINKNPKNITTLTLMLAVSRFLERIADHATNIAEDVIYMVDGDIVRHKLGM